MLSTCRFDNRRGSGPTVDVDLWMRLWICGQRCNVDHSNVTGLTDPVIQSAKVFAIVDNCAIGCGFAEIHIILWITRQKLWRISADRPAIGTLCVAPGPSRRGFR